MSEAIHPFEKLLRNDHRYRIEAYQFVREALGFAQDAMMGESGDADSLDDTVEDEERQAERHITGQQLCHAIRRFASEQFGLMAKVVLNSWGIYSTSDIGEIVYNLIEIQCMKKSQTDRREDFDDVYDFDEVFQQQFQITKV